MNTKHQELRQRTKQFALRVIKLFRALPRSTEAQTIGRQLLRSATSDAANYRAVGRARSRADFVSKIGVVVEESDECVFWIELLVEASVMPKERLEPLLTEASELLAIFAASQYTVRVINRPAAMK